jgi:hypothetical protein
MIAFSLRRNLTPSHGAPTMFMQIADRLSRLTRLLPQSLADARADDAEERRESGWHESSWVMAQGLDVIELPPAVAATLFPDTQPAAYYDPIGDAEPLAA